MSTVTIISDSGIKTFDLENNDTLYFFKLDHEAYDMWDALDELEDLLVHNIDDITFAAIVN